MGSIADMIESRIQRDADIKARQDAVRFEADLRALALRHGLEDVARSVSGPAVSAYIDARRGQLADRARQAVIDRLLDDNDR
ncbi:MAG: hypothetical protein KUL86_10750 [Castellaniella sp.]|nr:hypothetical protein [Castellaniella sp.]